MRTLLAVVPWALPRVRSTRPDSTTRLSKSSTRTGDSVTGRHAFLSGGKHSRNMLTRSLDWARTSARSTGVAAWSQSANEPEPNVSRAIASSTSSSGTGSDSQCSDSSTALCDTVPRTFDGLHENASRRSARNRSSHPWIWLSGYLLTNSASPSGSRASSGSRPASSSLRRWWRSSASNVGRSSAFAPSRATTSCCAGFRTSWPNPGTDATSSASTSPSTSPVCSSTPAPGPGAPSRTA